MVTLHSLWQRWWVRVLAIWAITRLIATALFLWVSSYQGESYWNGANPLYFDLLNIWDAEWYNRIYDNGYPLTLPTDDQGNVTENAWAFMPGFPFLVKLFSLVTTLEFKYASAIVSTLVSFALAIALYKTFNLKFDSNVSLWAVFLFGISPASPVLQTGYAETLGLLWLVIAIYFLVKHRYWLAVPFMALLSVTRPGMIALALMLGCMWLVRFIKARNGKEAFQLREQVSLAAVTVIAGILGFAWAAIAAVATGRLDAYFATELAWRAWTGNGGELRLLEPWFFMAQFYFGNFGWIVLLGLIGFAAWLMFSDSVTRLGNEMRLWVGSYFVYLLLVFLPQSSTFRLLLPAFPLAAALAWRTHKTSRVQKGVIIAGGILLQMVWLYICWYYASPDYTPP